MAPTATVSVVTSAAPSASATASAPPAEEKKACPGEMALVAGGKLAMGTPKKDVTVGAICLDVHEATADEYAACVKAGKCSDTQLKCAPQATYGVAGKGNHPINCVDYAQANAYCKAQDKRLPTPEEWEFAARGPEGRTYPWGNEKPSAQACWSGADLHTGTCPVGVTPAGDSPEGVHDLAGNVFEWTAPAVETKSTSRGGRGGSWKDGTPDLLRAARQGGFETKYRCGFLGIRCATAAPAGASPK
jgi:formylglycine-generating enzyme